MTERASRPKSSRVSRPSPVSISWPKTKRPRRRDTLSAIGIGFLEVANSQRTPLELDAAKGTCERSARRSARRRGGGCLAGGSASRRIRTPNPKILVFSCHKFTGGQHFCSHKHLSSVPFIATHRIGRLSHISIQLKVVRVWLLGRKARATASPHHRDKCRA